MRFLCLFGVLFFFGCYKNHLYVQQEWVDANFLASSKVGTPDPRQKCPPFGQRLIIAWDFPRSVFLQNLTWSATVRLWDNTEQTIYRPIERQRDMAALFFPSTPGKMAKTILTYRVQIFAENGDEIDRWDHQFWTKLIDVGAEERASSAPHKRDSVSSQPMQESVIDTP